jgi:predicted nucleic acid-binding protein
MPDLLVLDTDIDSRLPEPELGAWAQAWLARSNTLAVTAVTVLERRFGYQSGSTDWQALWADYVEVLTERTIEVLPLDFVSAQIAGHLRAECPLPPAAARRRKGRKKSARRASWILDILIAAIAAGHGHPLFTANRTDFALLSAHMPAPYRLDLVLYPALP